MRLLRTAAEVLAWRATVPGGQRVALVPTMGALHEGHASLLRRARAEVPAGEGALCLSIFVNPAQFGPGEDLASYPRDEAGDLATARAERVDVAFCPLDPSELWPSTARTWVEVAGLSDVLCGASRPGHFRGVATVCAKLWGLVRPDVSVFGEKDYQQLLVVRRMHRDLNLSGVVLSGEIVREPDGLAMSSRNRRLDPEARREARAIPDWLAGVRERFAAGERRTAELLAGAAAALGPGRLDYAELRDAEDLQPIEVVERPALCAVAASFGGVRLIDNVVLRP